MDFYFYFNAWQQLQTVNVFGSKAEKVQKNPHCVLKKNTKKLSVATMTSPLQLGAVDHSLIWIQFYVFNITWTKADKGFKL